MRRALVLVLLLTLLAVPAIAADMMGAPIWAVTMIVILVGGVEAIIYARLGDRKTSSLRDG